jgi:hypothetical protein
MNSGQKSYATSTAFRRALEDRLIRMASNENVDVQRLRREVAFDRFLTRLFLKDAAPWMLKGGYAMELRIKGARATRDIDLAVRNTLNEKAGGLLAKAPTIASSTATTSTTTIEVLNIEDLDPFAGVFADVSEPLKNTLNSMASSTVRVFDTAIFAMTGIFNEVIARVVRTDLLCIRNECINDTQLHSLVELLHGAQSLAPGGASSTEPFWQEPVPAPGVASTSVPTAEPANDLTNGGAGVSTSATPLSESPSTPLSQNPELEPATPIQTPTNNETGEPGGVTPTN